MYLSQHRLCKAAIKLLDIPNIDTNYNYIDSTGLNVLFCACEHKSEDIILKLLEKPDIDYKYTYNGQSLFTNLCENNLSNAAIKLMNMPDFDCNFIDITGTPYLVSACEN